MTNKRHHQRRTLILLSGTGTWWQYTLIFGSRKAHRQTHGSGGKRESPPRVEIDLFDLWSLPIHTHTHTHTSGERNSIGFLPHQHTHTQSRTYVLKPRQCPFIKKKSPFIRASVPRYKHRSDPPDHHTHTHTHTHTLEKSESMSNSWISCWDDGVY